MVNGNGNGNGNGGWSRRGLFGLGGLALGGAGVATVLGPPRPVWAAPGNSEEALQMLKDGNGRWASGAMTHPNQTPERRAEVAAGQHPWAAVFSCIDSRVPPEFVFDQGLGDLFVVRSAGAAMDDFLEGSLEYGPSHGTPLLVVLGHQRCGAITAAVKHLDDGNPNDAPGHLKEVVEAVKPAWEEVTNGTDQPADKIDAVTRAMTRIVVTKIKEDKIINNGTTNVVGGYYSLDSGSVEFS